MAQEINEVGTIRRNIEENVIFTSRVLRNIQIRQDVILIEYENVSDRGNSPVSVSIPAEKFEESEMCLWNAIDKVRKEV